MKIQGEKEKQQGIYYKIDANSNPIGVGGMGAVYVGVRVDTKTNTQHPVAIKCIYDDLPPHIIERARREAAVQLRNDNLVEMLGYIETTETLGDGSVVTHSHVVSELLAGVTLSDVMKGIVKDGNGEDVPYAVELLQEYNKNPESFAKTVIQNVLSGLMALHDANYIHRDIDPSNIMITQDRHIKLIDFGIAKQMSKLTTNDRSLTVAGKFMGKPEYAAPELVLGDLRHQDQTTDIYAMGILLYQLILGRPPFSGPSSEVLEAQLHKKIPLSNIKDKQLRSIISKACEKIQSKRYQSCAEMRVDVERSMNIGGTSSTEVMQSLPHFFKKGKYVITAVACIIVVMILAISLGSNSSREESETVQNVPEVNSVDSMQNVIMKDLQSARAHAETGYKHGEGYVNDLISAKTIYLDIHHKQQRVRAMRGKSIDLSAETLKLDNALQAACQEIKNKADALRNAGETDAASEMDKSLEKIKNVLNK